MINAVRAVREHVLEQVVVQEQGRECDQESSIADRSQSAVETRLGPHRFVVCPCHD
mgnify:CR=1 FL=1